MLNEKLQELYRLTKEINNMVNCNVDNKIGYLLYKIKDLEKSFEYLGINESGVQELHLAEIIFEANGSKDDLSQMYCNLDDEYKEFMADKLKEEYFVEGNRHFCHFYGLWVGDTDELIRLTHHAEGLYENTKFEYIHVEVRVDGKWYGR